MLTPNSTYKINGVTVNEKIIPDGTVWKDDKKAKNAGFSGAGAAYKKGQRLSGGTGKAKSVTIHNTNDLANVYDDGEQYTRATYNENMLSSRVHFYVDDTGAWQNLKAGTGMTKNDPAGAAEVSWHAGDGSTSDGGNMTSLSIEVIMNESAEHDQQAKDNGARLAAWLLWKHGLGIESLVTHTYWVNKSAGKKFADVDEQCTNLVKGKKWCPTYIFGSTNHATALKNWKAFKALVKKYLDALNGSDATAGQKPTAKTDPAAIWSFLIGKGLNEYGAAGLMGNLYAESALLPINLQNTYNTKLGMTDAEYTAAVDAGTYTNFVRDSAGYGLAQWTYWSRKQGLQQYAKSCKASIGDLNVQLGFLWKELSESYTSVLKALKTAKSVREASDIVLTNFERPANQSESVKQTRAKFGQGYYDKYAGTGTSSDTTTSYRVRITAGVLNIRKGPGTNYGTNGQIKDKGVYTIVAESSGTGATKWGKLKSGAGWISLDYASKI